MASLTSTSASYFLAIVMLLTLANVHGLLRGKRQTQDSVLCRITVVNTINDSGTREEQTSCISIVDSSESDDVFPVALPPDFFAENSEAIARGQLIASISGATLTDEGLQLSDDARFEVLDNLSEGLRHLEQRNLAATGTKSVAVVRISTADASPMFSSDALRIGMFGEGINLKTQYDACSFGQLHWELASVGVIDVKVNKPVSDFTSGSALVTAAQKQMKVEMDIASVSDLADKVLMCLPSGTGNWVASAGVNHWRAQFNNEWCLSLTATVHELGKLLLRRRSPCY